jgi:flagellar protein FlaJ
MKSSESLQKRLARAFSEGPSSFDLFYQLTYMAATAAAGISRNRLFQLARELPNPAAPYFQQVNELAENLRLNYPDACRQVGEGANSENVKNFLLRFSDSLRSGEPLAPYLAREAEIQGGNYLNEYERQMESLKKWNDGYTAITVSVALIVIINVVSSMIYDLGVASMMGMVITAVMAGFGVAWVIARASPQETQSVPLAQGSQEQRLARKLFQIFAPLTVVACLALVLLKVDAGWVMIVASFLLAPIGIVSSIAESKTGQKGGEISAFLRSVGGTATSRGTTLKEALNHIKIDSFPTLKPDIHKLMLRLNAFGQPRLCWQMFGIETGSKLIDQTTDIFFEAVNLGGDPEKAGMLSSEFALKTAMLRAKRAGVSGTFVWLTVVMHGVLAALMVFLLEIMKAFATMLDEAMAGVAQGEGAVTEMTGQMFVFNTPRLSFLENMTMGMVIMLALTNAFAMVSSEGSHLMKMSFYIAVLLFLSGVGYLVIPPIAQQIWL